MRAWLLLFSLLPGLALADACVVRSQAERLDVKVCQQNHNIPSKLFREGFCQPQLKGQTVEVEFVEQCPSGAYGVCQQAHVGSGLYRQDIHYYGVASDAAYLQPACTGQYQGKWIKP
ncbi:NADH:ubiquinone oxidoreductase [Pseudomonas sp. 8Z]|uniref:NADH:ubiquinone oxidoreductase n=1 Tax=Pseudomonas sp. 8Z TaxID=2653166 RepID=UPI0012F3858B|nr:NADH:ubiquinone oxidoreductase [Pseudomonas sp. 8Z]VXD04753.1 NADH:ubiquinone oxidoreductase [Pseudomonas sp. 8Z]